MSVLQSTKIALKALVRRVLARCGYFLGRYPNTHTLDAHLMQLFNTLKIDCVFDVGACDGDFGASLRQAGYTGHILSFEPVSTSFSELQKRRQGDPRWHAFHYALGETAGTAEINIFQGSTFNSFLSANEYGQERFQERLQISRTETVTIKRLEDQFDECLALTGLEDPHIFLKMDTQGFDQAVIAGTGSKLEWVAGLQTEISVKPIYHQMATGLQQSLANLQSLGFEITGMYPVTRDATDHLRVVEFDCVMCRPPRSAPDRPARTAASAH